MRCMHTPKQAGTTVLVGTPGKASPGTSCRHRRLCRPTRSHTSGLPLLPLSLWLLRPSPSPFWLLGPASRPELALSAAVREPSDFWSCCQTGTGRGARLGKLPPGAFQLQRQPSQSVGAEGGGHSESCRLGTPPATQNGRAMWQACRYCHRWAAHARLARQRPVTDLRCKSSLSFPVR